MLCAPIVIESELGHAAKVIVRNQFVSQFNLPHGIMVVQRSLKAFGSRSNRDEAAVF